jgi:hypothetical protein
MIVSALAPVVTTWLLGVLAGWRGDQDAQAARSLNTMVLSASTVTSSHPLVLALVVAFGVGLALGGRAWRAPACADSRCGPTRPFRA